MKGDLRTGYTTGACAAAATKAAILLMRNALYADRQQLSLSHGHYSQNASAFVEIPFPDGSRVKFKIHNSKLKTQNSKFIAMASVIKDAGDDPDITNGAEIVAEVSLVQKSGGAEEKNSLLIIKGGKGIGTVTKPGLPVPVGEPAINPVPRRMIREAVSEVIIQNTGLEITISVPNGKELTKRTLNSRLGIIGGISILGTTGIVKPLSSEAWTAAITASMDVAKAMGHKEIVLSAGRTSEKAHMKKYNLPEESYVMMGDYLEFSLLEAKRHGFRKIHLCAQWAKMLKIAMATPHTHVKHGTIDIRKTLEFLMGMGHGAWGIGHGFNTAREIFDFINSKLKAQNSKLFSGVCNAAKKYAEYITGEIPVTTYLVSYNGEILSNSS